MALFKFSKMPKAPKRTPQAYRISTVINEARPNRTSGHLTLAPFIRLRGLWLADAGFNTGDEITIHVEPGKLTITPRK